MTSVSTLGVRTADSLKHCKSVESSSQQTEPDNGSLPMKRESDRLKTFVGWPCAYVTPSSLAKAGFYYTKRNDLVRCAFCGIEIHSWKQGDDAMADHRKWSPNCVFVRDVPCDNVPMATTSTAGEDTCGKYGIEIRPNSIAEGESCTSRINLQKFGIQQNRGPSHPNYAVYENRLLSFTEWPKSMKQKPKDLAEAGFFYTGKHSNLRSGMSYNFRSGMRYKCRCFCSGTGDKTLCFHCGGGLKNWEEDDDPWEQHALWFSKCNFLILKKSPEFVRKVCNRNKALLTSSEASELVASTSAETPAQPETTVKESDAVKDAKVEAKVAPEVKSEAKDPEQVSETNSRSLCKICYEKEIGVVFLPCGHVVACVDCAPALSTCAVCRKPLEATFRAFLS